MRIFIVDDEEISCRGLSGMIGRILGTEENEIFTFTSSVEALEQAYALHPDVIFLDIIMPELNGIDFTARIKEHYSPEIIIISGNDDYNYVRRCFKLNVRDYLLKPIEFSELKNFLLKIKSDFEENGISSAADASNLPWVFTAVVKGKDVTDAFRDAVLKISDAPDISGSVKISRSREPYNDTLFTVRLSDEGDYNRCVKHFAMLFGSLAASNGAVYKAAYSGLYSGENSDTARSELFELFKSRLYEESSCCYGPEDAVLKENSDNPEFFSLLSKLPQFISYDDFEDYNEFVSLWFIPQKLEKLPYSTIKKQYTGIMTRLVNDTKLSDDLDIRNFREFNTIGEIIFEVRRVLDGMGNYYLERKQDDKNVIELALKFIGDNYQKNITLATVSNHYNLNYSYFSRIFKEFLGIPFSQYLLKIRMDKAREILINNPDVKISEVAKLVGYSGDNVQNFTRAFKNHFGKSPKNYKN